jgi:hypothetical protein
LTPRSFARSGNNANALYQKAGESVRTVFFQRRIFCWGRLKLCFYYHNLYRCG